MKNVKLQNTFHFVVEVSFACLMLGHTSVFASGPAHEHEGGLPSLRKGPQGLDEASFAEGRCQVSAKRIADFANGDGYDFPNLVNFLTVPACQANAREIGRAAMASGVEFKSQGPYRLDGYGKSLNSADLESSRNVEMALAKSIPQLLRTEPMGSSDLLPIMGQLSILSPVAARSTLTYLIRSELQNGDDRWQIATPDLRSQVANDLAQTLVKLGANRSAISNDLANAVGEMVLLEQAESLGKYFRALSLAAAVEDSLIPTFNLSASSFSRAVQRTATLASIEGKAALLKSAFLAAQSALDGPAGLEVGARDFNESLAKLLDGKPLTETALKKLWKGVLAVLAKNPHQHALGEAVALSLTPQMMFLVDKNRSDLVRAAGYYPALAQSVQQKFVEAHAEMWQRMSTKVITVAAYNRMREKYFRPLVSDILQFDPELVNVGWLQEISQRGLVTEKEVELRFPKLMLTQLKRREKAVQAETTDNSAQSKIATRAESLAVLLALTRVHLPTLTKWVRRQ